ncbi:MAG: Gfo/Idh/MocA family oxidoreductase [Firmicutes bacterium]|nr:Gfo/Idh/MocA family oxidoreductase [Bacillota bacterium]
MSDKVRVLVMGTGGMGRVHIQNLLQIEDAEIVGLVDPASSAIDKAKADFSQLREVKVYSEYRRALEEANAQAAVIVTPHSQHFEQGMACLDSGLHVLMEKPFVSGSANAVEMIARAKLTRRYLAVGYQRHTEGAYQYLRDLLQSGKLGTLRFVSAYQAQRWLEGTRGSWRQDAELSCGGQLNDSGSHLLDAVLWTSGLEPQEVSARIDNRGTPVDIDSAVTVRFRGGAIGSWNIVGSASIGWWEDVSFHGDDGTALYRNGKLFVAEGDRAELVEVHPDQFPVASTPDHDFIDLIMGRKKEAAAPAHCGYLVARLTEAAWQSNELGGRPVSF